MKKILNKLRDHKIKITPQRLAIMKYFEGNKDHPTAEDAFRHVTKIYPGISLATVYNTLEKMSELGQLSKVSIDPEKVHYDPDRTPHHHFLCVRCKNIYDIFSEKIEVVERELEGHQILEKHSYFKGLCKKCLNKKEGGAEKKE